MDKLAILAGIALDLTAALDANSRYSRLLAGLRRAIPYDAAALMRREGDGLVIKAAVGLHPEALERRFLPAEHPRLAIIGKAREPLIFPSDTELPDPFDGLLDHQPPQPFSDRGHLAPSRVRIHSCIGCPLYAGDKLIGLLTADAVDPGAFAALDLTFIGAIAALAGAEMHTTDLLEALELNAEKMGLIARDLLQEVRRDKGGTMLGESPAMQRLRREIALVASSDFSVLLTGETGVGKELAALALHAASLRHQQPLLSVNCANLVESLAESELFGHNKGAFTGAGEARIGKFELADGGTLFLDEIGELPLSVQPKLLRVLQSGEMEKLGGGGSKKVDVRLIAATNRDLEREVAAGRFRADLFHRLNVYPLRVPPLRERKEDLPLLAAHFCRLIARRLGTGEIRLNDQAMARLFTYSWPGNVRELENLLIRASLRAAAGAARGEPVTIAAELLDHGALGDKPSPPSELPARVTEVAEPTATLTLKEAVENYKRRYLQEVLTACGNNQAAAARALGLHRGNLHKLGRRLGLL